MPLRCEAGEEQTDSDRPKGGQFEGLPMVLLSILAFSFTGLSDCNSCTNSEERVELDGCTRFFVLRYLASGMVAAIWLMSEE